MRLYSVPFSYADVENHTCLLIDEVSRSSAKDCVINTLYFLKMFKKEDAEMYARVIHDNKMNGLLPKQIFDLIFEQFTLLSKTQDAIIKIQPKSLKEIKKSLEPNNCTFVGFPYANNVPGGHAVVIFKDNRGNLGIYDGQTHNLVNSKEGWVKWLESYSDDNIQVLYETDKRIRKSGRKDEKQPLKRVRKVSPQKSKSKSIKLQQASSKSKSVKANLEIPIPNPEKPLVKPPVVLEEAKKENAKSRKIHHVIKRENKPTGLEKNHQLRISQKVKDDKKKRENLLKINRRPEMDVVEEEKTASAS